VALSMHHLFRVVPTHETGSTSERAASDVGRRCASRGAC
jgi:hypothetical protein